MSAPQKENRAESPVVELKSSSFTLPVLNLFSGGSAAIRNQLNRIVGQAPDFFRNTPVVIDLSELAADGEPVDFTQLVSALRKIGMLPIGIRGGGKTHNVSAKALGLAILADRNPSQAKVSEPKPTEQAKPEPDREQPAPKPENETLLITQPIRSGQRVYAENGDLVVLAPVSHGAEIIADGNIHIYGTLRGRALAGAKGDTRSRIFCKDLQAELVSIAGHYRISENLEESVRGIAVQIYLDHLTLVIHPL